MDTIPYDSDTMRYDGMGWDVMGFCGGLCGLCERGRKCIGKRNEQNEAGLDANEVVPTFIYLYLTALIPSIRSNRAVRIMSPSHRVSLVVQS